MSSIDEVEYWNLMGAVESAEKLLHGVASGNTVLGEFVKNARGRMDELEKDGLVFSRLRREEKACRGGNAWSRLPRSKRGAIIGG